MANSTIPGLVAVTVPALTDLFGVRQSGDTRDKKLTVSQLSSLIGGGDVSKVGTPVNNQIGVWTGDGTIEGVPELTYTGVDFILGFNTGRIKGSNTNAGAILNEASSLGNPTLVPNTADSQTGIGGTADNLGAIVRGVAGTRWQHSTAGDGSVRQFQDLTTGIVASTTQTQGNGLVNGAAFMEVTTVANVDDVITLHNTGAAEYWTTIINTGANRLQIFPPVGDAILPGIVNASITLDVNKAVTLYTLDGTNWIRLVDPAGAGGGDVTKVGTPVDNQIGVWTGDGTIEGTTGLTYSGTILQVTGNIQGSNTSAPQMQNIVGTTTVPNLNPSRADPNTGFSAPGADTLNIIAGSVLAMSLVESGGGITVTVAGPTTFEGNVLMQAAAGPRLVNTSAGINTPTMIPDQADLDTGIGTNGGDTLSLICGGKDILQLKTALNQDQVLAGESGTALLPFYSWFGDEDTGFFRADANDIGVSNNGINYFLFEPAFFKGANAAGPLVWNQAASITAPTLLPNQADLDTGIGWRSANKMAFVAEGATCAEVHGAPTARQLIAGPAGAQNVPANPSLALGDGDSGFYESIDDTLVLALGATARWSWTGDSFVSQLNDGAGLVNEAASATNPTLLPRRNDPDSGIGSNAADQVSIIAGATEGIRVTEAAAVITNTLFGTTSMNIAGGPALQSEAATFNNPNVLPNKSDDDTGIGYGGADVLDLIAGASNRVRLTSGDSVFRGDWNANTSSGPALLDEGASSTNPTLVPNQADDDTGIGRDTVDGLAFIAGGVSCMRIREITAAPAVGFYTTTPIIQQTGVAVTAGAIHAALVALGLITA